LRWFRKSTGGVYPVAAAETGHAAGMRAALAQALAGTARGEPPFGVVIVDAAGRLLAANHDRVRERGDMSAHAEVLTVQQACAAHGPALAGCTLYTTCEPCPMCYTAAWLARITTIVYGTTMARVHEHVGGQQRELRIAVETLNAMNPEPLLLIGGIAADECLALFVAGANAAPSPPARADSQTGI
jgi:tRNA(Arg) A34 adenosine deaminase TadA